jgi:hypothetical protein
MKNFARIALLTLPLLVACKKKEDGAAGAKAEKSGETKPATPPVDDKPIELTETVELEKGVTDPDDKRFVGLKVKAPAGAKVESGMTGVLVRIGERQAYEIGRASTPGEFVAKEKAKANEDKLDKLVKFHIDTPDAILFESKSELGGENNFHFAAEVKLGENSWKCYNKGYGNFTKAQAEALLKSCQSVTQ